MFVNGDLQPISPDAADLIDSAQTCAAKMARCCADKDAEITRLENEALDFMTKLRRKDEEIAWLRGRLREIEEWLSPLPCDADRLRVAARAARKIAREEP